MNTTSQYTIRTRLEENTRVHGIEWAIEYELRRGVNADMITFILTGRYAALIALN